MAVRAHSACELVPAPGARANAYFMLCLPLSVVISSPLSGWILTRWNWRVMLIVEGVLPLIWLFVWLVRIDDHPQKAGWLSGGERDYVERHLDREREEFKSLKPERYLVSLFRPQVLLMVAIYFLLAAGCSGYLFWLPTVLGSAAGLSHMVVGILMILPFALTGVMMVVNSSRSDASGERRGHASVAIASAGVFLMLAVWMRHSQLLAYVLICLAAGGPYAALGPFWAIASETLSPRSLGAAMGVITGLGNLGGYFGPLWVGSLRQGRGNFADAFYLMGLLFLVASGLALFLKPARGINAGGRMQIGGLSGARL